MRFLFRLTLAPLLMSVVSTALAAPLTPSASQAPDPRWLHDLAELMVRAAQTAPELEKLVSESQALSKTTTLAEFLATIKICDGEGVQSARVNQVSSQRYFFIPRDLDEKPTLGHAELTTHYLAKLKADVPQESDAAKLVWSFGADTNTAYLVESSRAICIKAGFSPSDAVELLAHEMVHYTRGVGTPAAETNIKADSAREYAEKTVLEPGDEVDAYIEEDSLRIRRRGPGFYNANPQLAVFFNDYGTFVGRRETMASYILDQLGYMQNRFRGEYKSVVQNQLSFESQRLSFNQNLLEIRGEDVVSFKSFTHSRLKILNLLWPAYANESRRGQTLLERAVQSQTRLQNEIPSEKQLIARLQARLRGL